LRNQLLKVVALVVAVLFVSEPAAAGECDTRAALFKAAEAAGVPLNHEQTVTTSAPGVSFAGTSIAGFEKVPATRLPEGVDAGFIYLDAPNSGIPAGFYRLNARASKPQVGTYEGVVSLIAQDGKEVVKLPASMETWSMEVPSELPYEQTLMEAQLYSEPGAEAARPVLPRLLSIVIYCPNGTIIIIRIRVG
jgi:hypothetical protein